MDGRWYYSKGVVDLHWISIKGIPVEIKIKFEHIKLLKRIFLMGF